MVLERVRHVVTGWNVSERKARKRYGETQIVREIQRIPDEVLLLRGLFEDHPEIQGIERQDNGQVLVQKVSPDDHVETYQTFTLLPHRRNNPALGIRTDRPVEAENGEAVNKLVFYEMSRLSFYLDRGRVVSNAPLTDSKEVFEDGVLALRAVDLYDRLPQEYKDRFPKISTRDTKTAKEQYKKLKELFQKTIYFLEKKDQHHKVKTNLLDSF